MREATPKASFRIQWGNSGALKEIWRGIQVVAGLNRGGRSFPAFLDDRFGLLSAIRKHLDPVLNREFAVPQSGGQFPEPGLPNS